LEIGIVEVAFVALWRGAVALFIVSEFVFQSLLTVVGCE